MRWTLAILVLGPAIGVAQPAPPPANAPPAMPGGEATQTDRGMAGERTLLDELDEDVPLEVGAQLRIFQQARRRKKEIERLEGLLDRRARRLTALQEDVESRYKTLRLVQEEIVALTDDARQIPEEEAQALQAKLKAEQEDKIKRLSKVVDKMKAADAAQMLSVMDEPLVVQVMLRIKSKQAARILGEMEPKQAARIGEQMAKVKEQRARGLE
ncbi:MAG: hypothetical protein KC620_22400 [Myxococcales bacterium]|nr:hypothetical protein [Myxococcales bacterium]